MKFQTEMLNGQNPSPFSIGTQPKSRKKNGVIDSTNALDFWSCDYLFFKSNTRCNISCLQHAKKLLFQEKQTYGLYIPTFCIVWTQAAQKRDTGHSVGANCGAHCAEQRRLRRLADNVRKYSGHGNLSKQQFGKKSNEIRLGDMT